MLNKNFLTGLLFLLLAEQLAIGTETTTEQAQTERSGYWTYYCIDNEEEKKCTIVRKINIEEQNDTFLIVYEVTKNVNSKIKENLNITTPPASRVRTEKRLKISFDDKTKFTRSFLGCENDGCLAIFKSDRFLKYSLINFDKMTIIFYVFDDEQPVSLTLPMDGFVEALNNINKKLESM